jgi:hypothetical protein
VTGLLLYRVLAFLVAVNYFGFRTELFAREFDENHPGFFSQCAFTTPSLNWETYDKDNAPKAFVFHGTTPIEPLGTVTRPERLTLEFYPPYRPIQDKSPPAPFRSA